MRPRDRGLAGRLDTALSAFNRRERPLPGIHSAKNREVLVEQMLESIHRVKFVEVLGMRNLSARRTDPDDELFDPLKAAMLQKRGGNIDEAFWLVFLFVHFGRHARAGWRYAREVYGRLGGPGRWDWASTSVDPAGFQAWLDAHQAELKRDGVPGGFGNHRKYESLDAYSPSGTGTVVESYVGWVNPPRTHRELAEQAQLEANGDPRGTFDVLYRSMRTVERFGRTARFDYLTMVGKLGLSNIEAPSPYLSGATGPLRGARLLFGVEENARTLDQWLVDLGAELDVGMQVLEDSLCNWQKSPAEFKQFRG